MYYIVFLAVMSAWVTRRRLTSLVQLQFRYPFLIIIGLLGEINLNLIPDRVPLHALFLYICLGMIIGWIVLNRRLKGLMIILVGTLANIFAIALYHGAMPVLDSTLHLMHQSITENAGSRHIVTDLSGTWWWLGDWIPCPPFILSLGDIMIGIGVVRFVLCNTVKRTR